MTYDILSIDSRQRCGTKMKHELHLMQYWLVGSVSWWRLACSIWSYCWHQYHILVLWRQQHLSSNTRSIYSLRCFTVGTVAGGASSMLNILLQQYTPQRLSDLGVLQKRVRLLLLDLSISEARAWGPKPPKGRHSPSNWNGNRSFLYGCFGHHAAVG